jgi:two-component system, cell cycle sensor histidine kinase and response regulator CckA
VPDARAQKHGITPTARPCVLKGGEPSMRSDVTGTESSAAGENEQLVGLVLSSAEEAVRTYQELEDTRRELLESRRQLARYEQQRRIEAALSVERYRTLMQHAADAIFILDRRATIVEANTRAAEMLGSSVDELAGMRIERIIAAEEVHRVRKGLAYLLRVGPIKAVEQELLGAGDSKVLCEVTASLISVDGEHLVLAIFRDIRERRLAEEKLRARERQLADAQHIARVGSWDWDLGSDRLDASDEMFTIFGVPRTSAPCSVDFLRVIHPRDRDRVTAAISRAIAGEAAFDLEYRIVKADGSEAFIHARAETVCAPDGRATRMVGTAQDITDWTHTLGRLEDSEQRYRSLFQYNPDATYSLDLAGRFTSANPACSTLSGYDAEQLLGNEFDPLVVPEHRALARRCFDAACRGTPQTYQLGLMHHDGHRLELSVTNTPILVGGELVGVFGIAKDITERVRAEEALQQSEETLRTVVDASPLGILLLACDGTILNWSTAAARIFGWTAEEARERQPPFVPRGGQRAFRALCERVLAGDSLLGRELVGCRKNGMEIPISLSASPLRGSDGSITGIVATVQDLSEAKAAEQALAESQRQLQHAQKMEAVGRLAGGIAHDFNNLLTAIKGSAQILLLDTAADAQIREDLAEIDQAVDRATNLTRQLLTFSRKGVVEPRPLDLRDVVQDTEKMLRRMLREDITLETELGDESLCIEADPGQIEQVLINLVVNSRDAMPRGGRVTIRTRVVNLKGPFGDEMAHLQPGVYVLLSVTDTGCGMSPEIQQCVFDPFFTTKPLGQGTGLGLSTVYGIVQQSGGFIQLDSTVGRGSTFRVFLPRLSCSAEPIVPPVVPEEIGSGCETLLVVEDEPYVRKIVRRALERSGYRVLLARDGEDAIAQAARFEERIDLLITDVVMPGMSGAELAAQVRAARPALEVLYMSGYTDDVISTHGVLDAGVNFIQKPFSPHSLVTRVREVLNAAISG